MRDLLSTKVLSEERVRQLESAGWTLDQYDAISIEWLKTSVEPNSRLLIFTSKNGVKAFLKNFPKIDFSGIRCLCVGSRAAWILKEAGITVLEEAPTATQLAQRIKKRYSKESFVYYCGNRRLNLIPDVLDDLGVSWEEVIIYKTKLNPEAFAKQYDAVLFFSPSGVESFTNKNNMGSATGYCIGETTAKALRNYTDRILKANTPDIPGLIELAVAQINLLKQ